MKNRKSYRITCHKNKLYPKIGRVHISLKGEQVKLKCLVCKCENIIDPPKTDSAHFLCTECFGLTVENKEIVVFKCSGTEITLLNKIVKGFCSLCSNTGEMTWIDKILR